MEDGNATSSASAEGEKSGQREQAEQEESKRYTAPPLVLNKSSASKFSGSKSKLVVLNVAACLDGCDDQLLPASFRAMEAELGFHPSLLGNITLAQTMALSLSCPAWGYLADRYSRRNIMAIGLLSWGLATVGLGFTSRVAHVVCLRAINGMFLGSIGPISQSILADFAPHMAKGFHFGLIQMCASGGRVVGGVLMTSVAFLHFGGFYGWRWTFLAVGALSCVFGILVVLCINEFERPSATDFANQVSGSDSELQNYTESVRDLEPAGTGESRFEHPEQEPSTTPARAPPRNANQLERLTSRTPLEETRLTAADFEFLQKQSARLFLYDVIAYNFCRPSVGLILVEGILGMIPWSALSFLTLYFQYSGLSDTQAGVAAGCLYLGAMISGPLAGILGDSVSLYSPNHGRPTVGQLSMLLRIPLVLLSFLLLPPSATSFFTYTFCCLGLGLCSVGGVVVNRPLLADLVLPPHRATVFAITIALEGACGALLGAPLVGILSETVFGYVRTENLLLTAIPDHVKRRNATALGHSLVCLTCIPWLCSLITYAFIHWTYGTDVGHLQVMSFSEVGAGHIALICGGIMYLYMRSFPPGIAFTYCWLFYSFVALLVNSTDALACAFCIGFGLNLSWYISQVVDSLLWNNLVPYWYDYFPHWCTESLIRLGDMFLHPIPLLFLLPYHRFVRFRIFFYSFFFERWYFLIVERQPFGTGSTTNIIYDFRPHLPRRTFLLSQYFTNLGYLFAAVSQLDSNVLRIIAQVVCGGVLIWVCALHTDRWSHNKDSLPKFSRNLVGAALVEPAEPYTTALNAFSQDVQRQVEEHLRCLAHSERPAQILHWIQLSSAQRIFATRPGSGHQLLLWLLDFVPAYYWVVDCAYGNRFIAVLWRRAAQVYAYVLIALLPLVRKRVCLFRAWTAEYQKPSSS